MKFKYGTRRRAIEYEKSILEYWKKNGIFEKSVEQRSKNNSYVFYDGPPFITGVPHHGTLLSSIVKDAVPRYQTMKGKRVERVWGWDCHGLPAENLVEQKLGIVDRREIGKTISLADYVTTARESMVQTSSLWENTIDRIGRWVDFKGAYKTMDKDYMESVWWAFKELYEKGKVFEGAKVLMYDTKFATPVSKAEVTMDNDAYQTVTDPSVYVKFKSPDKNAYFLAWTTTPWTLPGNMALAISPKLEYSLVEMDDGKRFILATKLIGEALKDEQGNVLSYNVKEVFSGEDLAGLKYLPIYVGEEKDTLVDSSKFTKDYFDYSSDNSHKVWLADFVSDETGTGIVHVAPAYGEDDFELARQNKIPLIDVIDDNGYYLGEVSHKLKEIGVRPNEGSDVINVWDANKFIAKQLKECGVVEKIDYIRHEYPFNPRSKQRIMYRAIPSWFFNVMDSKPLMIEQNENISWFPDYLKHGRFENNIKQAPDWNLSRDRFWATAMPVWKSEEGTIKVFGSYSELEEFSGVRLDDYHRPWVDEIEFDAVVTVDISKGEEVTSVDAINSEDDKFFENNELSGDKTKMHKKEHFKRIDKVLDCWFESGSMPFAQFHYPFENVEKFEKNYPGDFIVEYIGQIRAWFYYVHAVNTALFGKNAYKNVIVTGNVAGNDGRKMSKSYGNFTDPNELMDKYSADSLRFLLLSSPLLSGEDFALQDKDVGDVARKLSMIWNMYDFFTMYAEVDKWESGGELSDPTDSLSNPLDIWVVSRLHQLANEIERNMDVYNIPDALSPVLPFIDDASNWFVRRSRRRFWKSEDDSDKGDAYRTLHYVLSYLSIILAPFVPFLSEELYQNLIGEESVHLLDWPKVGKIDGGVLEDMKRTRQIIEKGLGLRMEREDGFGQVKVRQPLSKLTYGGEKQLDDFYEKIILEEVNIKQVDYKKDCDTELDKSLTDDLRAEGFVRELIRHIQSARKKAGLNVDDRIRLSFNIELVKNEELLELVKNETLATSIDTDKNYSYDEIAVIDGISITLSLEKDQ